MDGIRSFGSSHSRTSHGLLERARRHDGAAWQQIVECYGPIVHSWLRAAGLDHECLPDVAQEVFLSVFRQFSRYECPPEFESFRAWLKGVAKRKYIDHLRRCARQPQELQLPHSTAECQFPDDTCDSLLLETQLLFGQVERFIRKEFPPAHCDAFFAISLEGQYPEDVAKRLGLSRNAVYLVCSRIRRRVREEFANLVPATLSQS